jgi:sigma-B regulation protein RsbU (phosphoserine phosphatase)
MTYSLTQIRIEPGDILTIYTDGIEESFNKQEEQFGDERIIETISINCNEEPDRIAEILFERIEDFSDGVPYSDDATIIIAKAVD